MIRLKAGVRGDPLTMMLIADQIVGDVYAQHGLDCWITSIREGKHKPGSKHPDGGARDYRVHNIPAAKRPLIYAALQERLPGDGYDVLWEYRGTPNEHFHVEWDPK